jgi:hypothetical protein
VGGEVGTKTKLSPARASLLGLSLAITIQSQVEEDKLVPRLSKLKSDGC